jgi:serine/threonine-protein kinase
VDWAASTQSESVASLADELQLVAGVAAVHRSVGVSDAGSLSFPPAIPFEVGSLVITARLGRGTYGEVFRAWDTQLHRDVALKLLFPNAANDDGGASMLEEGRILARVRQSNVLTVYTVERIDGRIGLVTEFIKGRTLAEMIRDEGPFEPSSVIAIAMDLCRALAAVHAAGLVHRDVKAQNVMLEDGGRIVLMDFGAGHYAEATQQLAGTPLFLAPEILEGKPASTRSDIYSLGVLMYYLLTAAYPLTGNSLAEIRAQHRSGNRTPLRRVRTDVPSRLAAIVERALDADPHRRYASADELLGALRRVRSPRRWAAAAALVMVIAAAAGATWMGRGGEKTAGQQLAFRDRDWVIVAHFDNGTGNPQFDGTLEHALSYELSNSTYVNVVPSERIADALTLMARSRDTVVDTAVARQVAQRDGGIKTVIAGRVEASAGIYALSVQIVDPESAAVLSTRTVPLTDDGKISPSIRELAGWIREQLGESAADIHQNLQQLERVKTPSLQALRLYSEAYTAGGRGQWGAAEELARSALAHDPDFASAHIWVAWSLSNQRRPVEEYLLHAKRAFDLADQTPERERYFIRGSYYHLTDDYERAFASYEALVRIHPDHFWGLNNLQIVAVRLARPPAQIAGLFEQLAASRPNDLYLQARAAQTLARLRGIAAAQPYVDRARALLPTPSGDGPQQTQISWIKLFPVHKLWVAGRIQEAAATLDAIAIDPQTESDTERPYFLRGCLYLTLGQLRRAEELFDRLGDVAYRSAGLAYAALARDDRKGTVKQLSASPGPEPLSAVSMLIRLGDLPFAQRTFTNTPAIPQSRYSAAELRVAAGDFSAIEALREGIEEHRAYGNWRALLQAETLADLLVNGGRVPDAIALLERTAEMKERLYGHVGPGGYLWLRVRKKTADLYRASGRTEEAARVEKELTAYLAVADDDHPIARALRTRLP